MRVDRHGVISAEEAYRRAALIIARIKAGKEPLHDSLASKLTGGPMAADLARCFLEARVRTLFSTGMT